MGRVAAAIGLCSVSVNLWGSAGTREGREELQQPGSARVSNGKKAAANFQQVPGGGERRESS